MRIPKIIIQTFKSRELPPLMKMAQRSWISKNPKWTYRFFTDEAVIKFVDEFDADQFEFSSIDLKAAFTKIRPGAGKADLFRYLYLAAHGGAYFDIDTVCKQPLDEYLLSNDMHVSGLGMRRDLHQWGIIICPQHPLMIRAAEVSVSNILNENFEKGYENSLEGLTGPPVLMRALCDIANVNPELMILLEPGVFELKVGSNSFQTRVLEGDLFGGRVEFKYQGYKEELDELGVEYWQDVSLFNR